MLLRGRKSVFDHSKKCSLEASDPLLYFSNLVSCNLSFFERDCIYIVEPDYLKTYRLTALTRKRSNQLCSSTLGFL